jgi:hypothetical protein
MSFTVRQGRLDLNGPRRALTMLSGVSVGNVSLRLISLLSVQLKKIAYSFTVGTMTMDDTIDLPFQMEFEVVHKRF